MPNLQNTIAEEKTSFDFVEAGQTLLLEKYYAQTSNDSASESRSIHTNPIAGLSLRLRFRLRFAKTKTALEHCSSDDISPSLEGAVRCRSLRFLAVVVIRYNLAPGVESWTTLLDDTTPTLPVRW